MRRNFFVLLACFGATASVADVKEVCIACHGAAGISLADDIPNLAGQKRTYLVNQLKALRAGVRKSDLMNPIAAALSDDDIARLADAFSAMPATPPLSAPTLAEWAKPTLVFPEGFPEGFKLYHRVESEAGGPVSLFYANAVAWQAAQQRRALPAGAQIVVAFHDRADATGGSAPPGALRSYSMMSVDPVRARPVPIHLRNGDWSYALFDASRRLRGAGQTRCLACHLPKASENYLFTNTELLSATR